MFLNYLNGRNVFKTVCGLVAIGIIAVAAHAVKAQQDFNGRELLSITLMAHGGEEYRKLQYLSSRSNGFVNVAPIVGAGLGTGSAASVVEIKFNLTDSQGKDLRRRLEVIPGGPVMGQTFLVYTGVTGGGMYMGNEFRVSESTASRHWGLMGFSTLTQAVDGQLRTDRLRDMDNNYVIEVKFNSTDSLRYSIDKKSLVINKVVSYYNGRMLVEEERMDYRKVGCMMLPYHVVTKLSGQRVSDLNIESYDITTSVPEGRFTISSN